jgi:hypothetical protein
MLTLGSWLQLVGTLDGLRTAAEVDSTPAVADLIHPRHGQAGRLGELLASRAIATWPA